MSATATLLTTVTNPDATQNNFLAFGTITLAGSYATNGDVLDLSQLGIPSNQLPLAVEIYEVTPAANKPAFGAQWLYLPGTTQANGILEAFNGTTLLTAATGTYASLSLPTGFALAFIAIFPSEI